MVPSTNGIALTLLLGLANLHAGSRWGFIFALVALAIGHLGCMLPQPDPRRYLHDDDLQTLQGVLLAVCVLATVLSFGFWLVGVI